MYSIMCVARKFVVDGGMIKDFILCCNTRRFQQVTALKAIEMYVQRASKGVGGELWAKN